MLWNTCIGLTIRIDTGHLVLCTIKKSVNHLNSCLSLSSVYCCRAGSGYPNGYIVLGNSRGGFPLPSSRFVITYCDQSFPSLWHCLSAAPSLSGATLLSTLEGVPYPQPRDAGGRRSAPAVCQSLTPADPTHQSYFTRPHICFTFSFITWRFCLCTTK